MKEKEKEYDVFNITVTCKEHFIGLVKDYISNDFKVVALTNNIAELYNSNAYIIINL